MLRYPNLRIVSDGTGAGTRLLDANGNEILAGNIRCIRWEISGNGPQARVAQVTLELMPVALEVTGQLAEVRAAVAAEVLGAE